jgi:hypothetical protein
MFRFNFLNFYFISFFCLIFIFYYFRYLHISCKINDTNNIKYNRNKFLPINNFSFVISYNENENNDFVYELANICNVGHFYIELIPNIFKYLITNYIDKNLCILLKKDILNLIYISKNTLLNNKKITNEVYLKNKTICYHNYLCPKNNFRNSDNYFEKLEDYYYFELFYKYLKNITTFETNQEFTILFILRKNRKIVNLDNLLFKLKVKYNFLNYTTIEKMNQKEIFEKFSKYNLIIQVYGAELIYPILLKKNFIVLLQNNTYENFYNNLMKNYNQNSNTIIFTNHTKLPNQHIECNIRNIFYYTDLILTEENIEKIIEYISKTKSNIIYQEYIEKEYQHRITLQNKNNIINFC